MKKRYIKYASLFSVVFLLISMTYQPFTNEFKEFNYKVYADSDNDSLSDGQEEFVLGTDPNDNDRDDDTLLDGVETNTGTWISTSNTGTDPLSNDSDGDGLSDGYELSLSEFSIIQIDSNNWYDAKLDAENQGGYRPGWWKYLHGPTVPAQHAGQSSIPADGLQRSGAACAGGLLDPDPADGPRRQGASGSPGHPAARRYG